jgi:actinorhodin biosynthesis protein ActVIA
MSRSLLPTVCALAVGFCLSTGARPAAAQSAPALTALDYFEIQQLVSKYARAIDTCSNNGYDYADLFTADGYFAPEVNGKVGNKMQGRERLAEASGGGSRGCKNVGWIRQGVKHLYVNHIITPTAEGATGTVDMLMIGLGGDPNKIHHEGYYEDTYVKTAQGWRFKSRIHHVPEGGTTGQSGRGSQPGQPAPPAQTPGAQNPER